MGHPKGGAVFFFRCIDPIKECASQLSGMDASHATEAGQREQRVSIICKCEMSREELIKLKTQSTADHRARGVQSEPQLFDLEPKIRVIRASKEVVE